MEVTVGRAELAAAVTWAASNLPKRPVAPVLAGIRLAANGGRLEVAVFDYETSARTSIPAVFTDEEGTALVEGKPLLTAVKSLPKFGKPLVTLTSLEDDAIEVACDGTMSAAGGLPLDEYPALPEVPEPHAVIDAAAFKRAIASVVVAAGKDDTLPTLTCILMQPAGESLVMAATDRYRLASDAAPWTVLREIDRDKRFLVPAAELADFAKGATGKVTIAFDDTADAAASGGFASFSDDTRTLTLRTRTGQFPNYSALFRDEHSTTLVADAAALAGALKTTGDMSDGKYIKLHVSDGQVGFEAYHDGKPSSRRSIPAQLDGEPMDWWVHAPYLAGMVAVLKGRVRLSLVSPLKPVELTRAEGGSYRAVIVPVRPQIEEPKPADDQPADDQQTDDQQTDNEQNEDAA